MATPSNPSKFERRVKRAAKVGNAVISEFLAKIQASIARQEESIEALRICLKVLMKKGKESHPSVALVQERVVAHNRESDLCRMLLEDVNFLKLKLEGEKGDSRTSFSCTTPKKSYTMRSLKNAICLKTV